MPYFGMTCDFCHRQSKVQADTLDHAKHIFQHTYVCLASVHPSLPSLYATSRDLHELSLFEFRHSAF